MKKGKVPNIKDLLLLEESITGLTQPIPFIMSGTSKDLDAKGIYKHQRICQCEKWPCITITNGIPSDGSLPEDQKFKTTAAFIRSDITHFLDSNAKAAKYKPLLVKRLHDFVKAYSYMLIETQDSRPPFFGTEKTFSPVQWCYCNIYARMLCITLTDFMRACKKDNTEELLNVPIKVLLTNPLKRKSSWKMPPSK